MHVHPHATDAENAPLVTCVPAIDCDVRSMPSCRASGEIRDNRHRSRGRSRTPTDRLPHATFAPALAVFDEPAPSLAGPADCGHSVA